MKVDELQLYDWVFGIDGAGNRHPCIIAAIDIYPTNKSPRIVTLGGYGYQEENLEPIPFTEKLLQPNGFHRTEGYFVFEDDYYDLTIHLISDSIWLISYRNCEINLPDERIMFSYVHELQHFLRHCKIEKKIFI